MLNAHDDVPHFSVLTVEGGRATYSSVWQHRHLVLVCLPGRAHAQPAGLDELDCAARLHALAADDVAVVVTRDAIAGIDPPAALVADRWGEIVFVSDTSTGGDWPRIDEIAEWVHYVRMKCPECEGEAR